jgi:hypothetical protein
MSAKDKKDAIEELRQFANEAYKSHANSIKLKEFVTQINNAYLDLAKPSPAKPIPFNPVIK